nr:immunoglobulin light chain junction region [Macaca mulatta]MOW36529.1 immunoglobulin light chain junction region [Macaca mulatta]MOW36619.1 immunoglobulin light chain junction region [Macaca mulatta]MOW36686.1 immunoglobulin light chain junction region [Macaca mulatta]MOW37115.1 immunoglobulin light chain junction region [Macaca mulatta]
DYYCGSWHNNGNHPLF